MSNIITTQNSLETLAKSMTAGSLRALVSARKKNAVVLLDTSASMSESIGGGGPMKITQLREVAATLREMSPNVPFIAFHGAVAQVVEAIPDPSGNTPLAKAINYAKQLGAQHAVVISDGEPNDTWAAREAARNFGGQIDTFFVGNPHSFGAQFLQEIADLTGGKSNVTDLGQPKQLGQKIAGMLGDGKPVEKEAIQL